jgi:hypothetical protein
VCGVVGGPRADMKTTPQRKQYTRHKYRNKKGLLKQTTPANYKCINELISNHTNNKNVNPHFCGVQRPHFLAIIPIAN